MQTHMLARKRPPPIRYPSWPAPRAIVPGDTDAAPTVPDRIFLALLGSYRASGGLARIAEVAIRLERVLGMDARLLARWRADRRVICFDWQAQSWLPRFQFARAGQLPDRSVAAVLAELDRVFDDCETAQWFGSPNSALAGRAPVDVINEQPLAVLQAARTDRFIANG